MNEPTNREVGFGFLQFLLHCLTSQPPKCAPVLSNFSLSAGNDDNCLKNLPRIINSNTCLCKVFSNLLWHCFNTHQYAPNHKIVVTPFYIVGTSWWGSINQENLLSPSCYKTIAQGCWWFLSCIDQINCLSALTVSESLSFGSVRRLPLSTFSMCKMYYIRWIWGICPTGALPIHILICHVEIQIDWILLS